MERTSAIERPLERKEFLSVLAALSLAGCAPKELTPQEASGWLAKEVFPQLELLISDEKVPVGIRERVKVLFTRIRKKEIEYISFSNHVRNSIGADFIAKIHFGINNVQKVDLLVFVPALKNFWQEMIDAGLSPLEQRIALGTIYAHEEIHIEQQLKFGSMKSRIEHDDRNLNAREEAAAWATTINEMIWPTIQDGYRVPKLFMDHTNNFARVRNNPSDPRWIANFLVDPNVGSKK